MKVKLWGARGGISIPRPQTRRYGVNTLCVQVESSGSSTLILDGGIGLNGLGNALFAGAFGRGQGQAHLLFSHTHWSHIQGVPFCLPLLIPGNAFRLFGRGGARSMRALLLEQMQPTFCPVPNFFYDHIGAQVDVCDLDEKQPLQLGEFQVEHAEVGHSHGGPCTAYRISDGHATLAYLPVVDYRDEASRERAAALCRGADLLIHDAYHSDDEYPARQHSGHSCPLHAADVAGRADAKHLILFNHHPMRTDDELDAAVSALSDRPMPIEAGCEGNEYSL